MAVVYYVGGPLHDQEGEVSSGVPSITVPDKDEFGTYYLYPVRTNGDEPVFAGVWKGSL